MPRLTEEERAERKALRRARRKRTWRSIKEAVAKLVQAAELVFPDSGQGSMRHEWVSKAAKAIKTPLGDELETAVLNYLIELAVDALNGEDE
jgi:hypothetical protein